MLLYVFPSQARYGIVYFIDMKGEIRTKNQSGHFEAEEQWLFSVYFTEDEMCNIISCIAAALSWVSHAPNLGGALC